MVTVCRVSVDGKEMELASLIDWRSIIRDYEGKQGIAHMRIASVECKEFMCVFALISAGVFAGA